MKIFKVIAGLDIGNGYVKGVISTKALDKSCAESVKDLKSDEAVTGFLSGFKTDTIHITSGVTMMTRPVTVPVPDASAKDFMRGDTIYDSFDASFVSPVVENGSYRRLFGKSALVANGIYSEFDVMSGKSKALQSLSKELTLGLIAANVLKNYVELNGSLPKEEIQCDAVAALALPITEYMAYRQNYASEFLSNSHIVVVQNFETQCTIRIHFVSVQVVAEGASAQYAIAAKGIKLADMMLRDVRSHGVKLEGVTAEDVFSARNTIGIDIGEGTVNFPVFSDGTFNPHASASINKGYGTVLSNALQTMETMRVPAGFTSRKQLSEYLQREPTALTRGNYDRIKSFVDQEIVFFADEVAKRFSQVLGVVASTTEVVYVYGGGSSPIKDILYPKLLDRVKEVTGTGDFAVLYLDAKYSGLLNREGLYIAATSAAKGAIKAGKW